MSFARKLMDPMATTDDLDNKLVDLTTHSGFVFGIRRARPDDASTVGEFFTHVTPENLRFRFLSCMREVSHERLVAMTGTDDQLTSNVLGFAPDGALIAVAMLVRDPARRTAEVAISVRSDHKKLGVGWQLLALLAGYAKDDGIETIESIESRDHHEAIELEREMGFTVEPYRDDSTLVLVKKRLADGASGTPRTGATQP